MVEERRLLDSDGGQTMDVTVYFINGGKLTERTCSFPFRTENSLRRHLTSLYGRDKMDDVYWDIWEPEEEEGLEEVEEPDSEIGSYLKRKMRKGKR